MSLTLIRRRARLSVDIRLPLLALVFVLVADIGDMGDTGDSMSPVYVRWTNKCRSTFSLFLNVLRMSSEAMDLSCGRERGGDRAGRIGIAVTSSIFSVFSCGTCSHGSSGMLPLEGDLGNVKFSLDGAKYAWFNLGTLRLFMRLMALATPLNIFVGVLGVLGRSSSIVCLDTGRSWLIKEYVLRLAYGSIRRKAGVACVDTGGSMLLVRGGCMTCNLEAEECVEDMVEVDNLLCLTSASTLGFVSMSNMLRCRSVEIGEMDRRACGTSTTDGFPEKMTDTTLAVTSRVPHSLVGEGDTSSLLESYSKSEKSPAVEEASSSEDRYSS